MWLQIHLTVDKPQTELTELLFERLGAVAVTLGDAGDEPMLEPAPGETPLWQATRVTGLFAGDTDPDHLRNALNLALSADTSRSLRLEIVEDQDWERSWLDLFGPMQFGDRLWIRPTGSRIDQPEAVVIELDPGLAFGTGTHPTTALCLTWLDQHDMHDKSVVDFGCGSGVLGIAALKLGASRVIAVDHDPQAVLATQSNAERNGVADRLTAMHSNEFTAEHVDVVLANILANILIDLNPLIGSLARRQGTVVLSGLLTEQSPAVQQAYADRFTFTAAPSLDGWALLHGTKK
jgi:ribosomal protein L11 methyltransferase